MEPISAGAIIGGVIAFLKAIPILDGWFQQLIAAYIMAQNAAVKAALVDAAALAARAQTDDERYKASAAWQAALQKSRVSA